jgi:hypothetical protein
LLRLPAAGKRKGIVPNSLRLGGFARYSLFLFFSQSVPAVGRILF